MPSRRHSSEMFSSPRSPSSTMRIFSSAEYCRRVWRRMSFSTCSAGALPSPDFCFIFAPYGYDEPEILPPCSPTICLTGADGEHLIDLHIFPDCTKMGSGGFNTLQTDSRPCCCAVRILVRTLAA